MMDLALKKRLIGASVIIALVVIFVPMFFDEENVGKNQSISIDIPDEPQDLKHRVIQIDTSTNTEDDGVVESTIVAKNKAMETVVQETIIDVVDNSQNTQVNNNTNINSEKPDDNSIQDIDSVSVKEEVPKSVVNNTEPTQQEKPVATLVTQEQTAQEVNQAAYRIKLGSFSKQKNAQQLKAQIINLGVGAVVQEDKESGLFKVFSQSYASVSEATKNSQMIEKSQLKIGKPSVEIFPQASTQLLEAGLDSGWIVQIGSFSNKTNSLKLRDKIRDQGFVAFIDEIVNSKDKDQKFYRLRIGPYVTREEALAAQKSVKQKMQLDGIIKPHEKRKVVDS